MSDSRSSTGRRPNGQGSYFRRRGSWFVQVTGSDGTRSKPIKFPGDWTEEQVAAKTARLAALAAEATTGRTVGPLETTAAWFGRWPRRWYGRRPTADAVFAARCRAVVIPRCDLCGSSHDVRHVSAARWRTREGQREPVFACATCRGRLLT